MNRTLQMLTAVWRSGRQVTCLTRNSLSSSSRTTTAVTKLRRFYSVYEPDGLDDGPAIPEYEALNIQMKSYDFVKLEAYAKYVHNVMDRFDLDSDIYPVPARTSKVQTFKPNSSIVQNEYNLALHERIVQITDIPSTTASLLFEVLHQHLPSGVNLTVKEPDPDEEEFRFLPDREIDELKLQLTEIAKSREDRRKK